MTAERITPPISLSQSLRAHAQGVVLCLAIALAASFLAEHYGAPVMLLALLIGMALNGVAEAPKLGAGVAFSSQTLLRVGVALLGARVTFDQIASLGPGPLILAPSLVIVTIIAGLVLSRLIGRDWRFGVLAGGAVAICGASAALAIAAAFPRTPERERDTLFVVIAVTTLSTAAMILYPVLFEALRLREETIGLLIGATIHDVAQVVGAGYAVSPLAGDVATYVKMLRVALLPVMVLGLALFLRVHDKGADSGGGAMPLPWFAFAFAGFLAANSFGLIPGPARDAMNAASRMLLVTAIAALGLKTSVRQLLSLGPRPALVVVIATGVLLFGAVLAVVTLLQLP